MAHGSRLSLLCFVLLVSPVTAEAATRSYNGICEASAAALIDRSHVAVASDDYDAIVIYERGKAEPVARVNVDDVTDIEAAARIGDTVFWLTSHSLNSSGEDKKKRKLLFSTNISAAGTLTTVGATFRNLRADIAKALGRTEDRLKPLLNIEGLADTPDGHLLVGLRGPETIPDDRAILVEVANPTQLMAGVQDAEAQINRVVTLDLSDGPGLPGRGVRDIARVGSRYLILAGSEPDGGVPPPKLFWWDGNSDGKVKPGPAVDFSGMTPEAVVVWSEHDAEVFSDNGGAIIDGQECGDKNPPKGAYFPAVDVTF